MKSFLSFLLLGVVSACCSSWIRDSQTAKNIGFIIGTPNQNQNTIVPIVQPPTATNIKDLQVQIDFVIERDLDFGSTQGCACECTYCRYYLDVALVVNIGQGVSLPVIDNTDTPQTFPVSLPRNDSFVLYGAVGSLSCYDQVFTFSYNSAQDSFFDIKFPDGIQLNGGDQVQVIWKMKGQVSECASLDGNVLIQATGIGNYVLSYGECPVGEYEECVEQIERKLSAERKH